MVGLGPRVNGCGASRRQVARKTTDTRSARPMSGPSEAARASFSVTRSKDRHHSLDAEIVWGLATSAQHLPEVPLGDDPVCADRAEPLVGQILEDEECQVAEHRLAEIGRGGWEPVDVVLRAVDPLLPGVTLSAAREPRLSALSTDPAGLRRGQPLPDAHVHVSPQITILLRLVMRQHLGIQGQSRRDLTVVLDSHPLVKCSQQLSLFTRTAVSRASWLRPPLAPLPNGRGASPSGPRETHPQTACRIGTRRGGSGS